MNYKHAVTTAISRGFAADGGSGLDHPAASAVAGPLALGHAFGVPSLACFAMQGSEKQFFDLSSRVRALD
jgi:hypothetical protein